MSDLPVEVAGTVREDGTLELDEKLHVPAGRVKVTVQSVESVLTFHDQILATIEKIRASQAARGYVPRSAGEIDAELNAAQDEAEEEFEAIERMQEDASKAREEQKRLSEESG